VFEHDRFEQFAHLEAIGELEGKEREEFLLHRKTCAECCTIVAEARDVAVFAFVAGSPTDGNDPSDPERHRRMRENLVRRLPAVVPVSVAQRYKHLALGGIAAGLLVGATVGAGLAYRVTVVHFAKPAAEISTSMPAKGTSIEPARQDETNRLQAVVADLEKKVDEAKRDDGSLRDKLAASDERADTMQSRLNEVENQSNAQTQDVQQSRADLAAAQGQLSQAKDALSASQTRIDALQYQVADREARLTDVSASLDRERDMLSQGREVRDIMGARDLHIVDVVDRDGSGHPRKAFGRAFYTQGKSLIFYAFDLPAKNTADGKFVYAAWGSNSNDLNGKVARSLGIFYNDDQTQHRWAMKFDDAKLLEEIDTVFVTLEPAGKPFAAPTGKPLLEAYFGTPPNHP
jgi:TolA-binding protein